MDAERLTVKKFRQYVFLGQLVSVGLFIFGLVSVNQKQDNVLQVVGWLFLALGIAFIVIFNRRKQRLLWIYKHISPTTMKMNLEKVDDSDSTSYVAYLTRHDQNNPGSWKANLYPPACNVQPFLANESQVDVYLDPKNNHPAIIRTTEGLLWVMAGSGAVQNWE